MLRRKRWYERVGVGAEGVGVAEGESIAAEGEHVGAEGESIAEGVGVGMRAWAHLSGAMRRWLTMRTSDASDQRMRMRSCE